MKKSFKFFVRAAYEDSRNVETRTLGAFRTWREAEKRAFDLAQTSYVPIWVDKTMTVYQGALTPNRRRSSRRRTGRSRR